MKIKLEDLTLAIDTIINNPTTDYPQIVTILQSKPEFQNYNVEEILFLFLQALTIFWSNPLVGKWSDPNTLIPYATARDMLIATNMPAYEIAKYISQNISYILMKAKLEPVYLMEAGKVIFTATNNTIEEIYKIKKELEQYTSIKQERYTQFENTLQTIASKYNITDLMQFTQDILSISEQGNVEEYLAVERKLNELQTRFDTLIQEIN